MKNPKVNKLFIFGAYGCAIALGFFNVKMSALGLAVSPDKITATDWFIGGAMMAFEACLAGSVGSPSFWPIMLGSATTAINKVLDISGENKKYQYLGMGLLILFVGLLIFVSIKTYQLDILTTQLAIFPKEGEPTQGMIYKVYSLVFGPECLLDRKSVV